MQPKSEKQQQAQNLYLHTDRSAPEIADILNLNRKTIYLWIKNGKWEEMRRTANQAPDMVLNNVYNHIEAINDKISNREDHCPTMQEVSMLSKLLNMTTIVNKNHVGSYIQAFEELIRFISRKDLDFCKKLTEYADRYVRGTFGNDDFHHRRQVSAHITAVEENLAVLDKESIPGLRQYWDGTRQSAGDMPEAMPQEAAPGAHGGNDIPSALPIENIPESAPVQTKIEINDASLPQNTPSEKITENGALPTPDTKLILPATDNIPASMLMSAGPVKLHFEGFWKEENSFGLPATSGIYCVYEATYNPKSNITCPCKVLAIGEADNIKQAVADLLPNAGWKNTIREGTVLCFSYASIDGEDRLRAATALIHQQKPPFNTEYNTTFPFGHTTIHTSGQAVSIARSFTINSNK
jgi:predicted DNA-binding protein YlxM (UPF0122 family)